MSKMRRISASVLVRSAKSGSCHAIAWRVGAPRPPSRALTAAGSLVGRMPRSAAAWLAALIRAPGHAPQGTRAPCRDRSEEHTSELQSHLNLVCRLLLEKKKKNNYTKRTGQNACVLKMLTTIVHLKS